MILAFVMLMLAQSAPPPLDLRAQVERAAAKLKYFPTGEFLFDRIEERLIPKDWQATWREAHRTINLGVQAPRADILALLKHENPTVRTLALGILYQQEDPKNIGPIAGLLGDDAQTVPDVGIRIARTIGSPKKLDPSEIQAQTVGQVARTMLKFMLEPAGYQVQDLDKYLQSRKHRTFWASWYQFRFWRAYQGSSAFPKSRHPVMQALRRDIEQLPQPDRDWILLYLAGVFGHPDNAAHFSVLIAPAEFDQVGKRLGRERLLDLLANKTINDDPDLAPTDPANARPQMAVAALKRAKAWLRAEDAAAVLAAPYRTPARAIAAAELQPENANKWLRAAMAEFANDHDSWERGELMAALWMLLGDAQLDYVVDWMYTEKGNRTTSGSTPMDIFVSQVDAATPAATRTLVTRIVNDRRFEQVPLAVLRQAILLINRLEKTEIVPWRDLYDGWTLRPSDTPQERQLLAEWRGKLKQAVSQWK